MWGFQGEMQEFSVLKGLTLTKVEVSSDKDEMIFYADNGKKYKLYHAQD